MILEKQWVYREPNRDDVDTICRGTGVSTLTAKVLAGRGFLDNEKIREFLHPSLDMMLDPFLLKDMDRASDRVLQALDNNEKIVIYGDYDVDGVTSTAILYHFLLSRNARVDYFIPDRLEEGYGLSPAAVEKVLEMQPSLIITVDCGVTAIDEVGYICSKSVDVVITDHHECREELPDAAAVVNPSRHDCGYPFKELAGVGVTYKLITALCIRLGLGNIHHRYLDLVAIGTVADVVPLVEENRVIVSFGLESIRKSENYGVQALLRAAELVQKPVSAWTVAFGLAPRINAAGRIQHAAKAVRMFVTENAQEAMEIASELNQQNRFRQETEQEILGKAIQVIETEINLQKEKVIVAAGENWHHGVIGIVASRVTERYNRPCILLNIEDGMAKGSGRSIEGFNLYLALVHCGEMMEKFGGHELAAGLSMKAEKLGAFREKINEYADEVLEEKLLQPKIKVDAWIDRSDISLENVRELELLGPNGAGNPGPVFAYDRFNVFDCRSVGDGKHLKMKLQDKDFFIDAIGFNMGKYSDLLECGDEVALACTLDINTWNSRETVQLVLKDLKPLREDFKKDRKLLQLEQFLQAFQRDEGEELKNKISSLLQSYQKESIGISDIVPQRKELEAVYQKIKSYGKSRLVVDNLFLFARTLSKGYNIKINYFKTKKCLEVFQELRLLKLQWHGDFGVTIEVVENGKVNLEDSVSYRKLQFMQNIFKGG